MRRCIHNLIFLGMLGLFFGTGINASATGLMLQDGRDISGTVSDINGEPVPGVTIIVKGTTHGTTSDTGGSYQLQNITDNAVLVFSFIGMSTVEETVGARTIIDVVLEEDAVGLEEVVAIGYGSLKKKDLTGSVASVSTDDMASLPLASIGDAGHCKRNTGN